MKPRAQTSGFYWTVNLDNKILQGGYFSRQTVSSSVFFHLTLGPESNDSLNTETLFADWYHDPTKGNHEPGEFSCLIR